MMQVETGWTEAGRRQAPSRTDIRVRLSAVVATAFRISAADLEKRTRRIDIARARQAAIYLARVVLRMTLRDAGRLYGRDRSTAAHACRVIEDLRDNHDFDRLLCTLETRLQDALPARTQP